MMGEAMMLSLLAVNVGTFLLSGGVWFRLGSLTSEMEGLKSRVTRLEVIYGKI